MMDDISSVVGMGVRVSDVVARGDESGADCGTLIGDSCAGRCETRALAAGAVMPTGLAGGNAMASTETGAAAGVRVAVDEWVEGDESGVCSDWRPSRGVGRDAWLLDSGGNLASDVAPVIATEEVVVAGDPEFSGCSVGQESLVVVSLVFIAGVF